MMKTQNTHTMNNQAQDSVRMAATKTAEHYFEQAFKQHMHSHIGNFKAEYRTLYNKVIIPIMETMILANSVRQSKLENEKEELRVAFSDLADLLMKVKPHLNEQIQQEIDDVLSKYIS